MTVVINGTSGITDVNGTAAAPAITGTDTDTGVFFGTNTVSLSTGGTERLQVDSSGNLGLGVTPSAWASSIKAIQFGAVSSLSGDTGTVSVNNNSYYTGTNQVYLTNAAASQYYQNNGSHVWRTAGSGTAGNAISFTQAMTLDASGNLLIGATSGSYPLLVKKAASSSDHSTISIVSGTAGYAQVLLGDTASDAVGYLAYNNSTNALEIATNGSERARIDSSGNLLVGSTSNTSSAAKLRVYQSDTGNPSFTSEKTTTAVSNHVLWYNPNGAVGAIGTNGSTTYYNTSSDYRLKENIEPMTGALAKVDALKPVIYTWKTDGSSGQGFIAHELAEVVPDAVTGAKDAIDEDGNPVYQGIDTSFLVATLTAAIQELNAKFEAYKATHP